MTKDNSNAIIHIFPNYGNELKKVNLSKAREFARTNFDITPEEFFHNSGLKLLLDSIHKNIEIEKIRSCFFEYSTLCSTIENKGLSSFICLAQKENYLNTDNLTNDLNRIIGRLFEKKLSLYYLQQFFINPRNDLANLTILPDCINDLNINNKEVVVKFNDFLSDYQKDLLPNISELKKNPLLKVEENVYVQNMTLEGVDFEQVIVNSQHFSQESPLPNHLLLHQLYDNELLCKKNRNVKTILLSIPMLGAPIMGNENGFNGQGAFFLYLIVDESFDSSHMDKLVWDISNLSRDITYNYLFEVGYKKAKEVIEKADVAKKATIKSAIIQYMARNLSHNTGSHLIPEAITYFSKVINTNDDNRTKQIRDDFTYYQKYTQERMELLAQLSSMKNNHNWSNYNLNQIVKEFNASIIPKGLCDDLNNIQKEIKIILKNGNNDFYVSLPDGAVGKQAFYVILENFVRNAYKHANAGASYLFEIYVSQPVDGFHKQDFWCVDIFDKLGDLNESKRTPELLEKINKDISDSVLTENSQLRDSGWGMLEMKSAAAFLVGFPLENLDDFQIANFETRYYSTTVPQTNKNIGHRFYLRKPRILLIDSDIATQEQKNNAEQLKSIGIQIKDFHHNFDKEPHQFLLTDKKIDFTNQKILNCTINTNQRISEIENDLWKEYIKLKNWNNCKIISSQEEQDVTVDNTFFFDKHGANLFFDSHGKELSFGGQRLKEVTADYIKNLNLPFYHPYKSRSGIGSLLLKSKSEERFKGLLFESAFKKILIIDERIQNASRAKDNDQGNLTLQEIFSFMGITVPLRSKLSLSGFLENPSKEKADEIVELILDKTYDYVLVHLTILEKLAGKKEKKELENFINDKKKLNEPENFKAYNRALVLVSGRGEPPNLPMNSYYLNYTTLYDCLIYLMSKPHLIQILNTLRRR